MDFRQMSAIVDPQIRETEKRLKELQGLKDIIHQIDKQGLVQRKDEEWAAQLRQKEDEARAARERIDADLNQYRKDKQIERNRLVDKFDKDNAELEKRLNVKRGLVARAEEQLAQKTRELEDAERQKQEAQAVAQRIMDRNRKLLEEMREIGA